MEHANEVRFEIERLEERIAPAHLPVGASAQVSYNAVTGILITPHGDVDVPAQADAGLSVAIGTQA